MDGYNFYYGLLEGTAYKWLNIESFFAAIVRSVEPLSDIDVVYYFTSPVKANLSAHGKDSFPAQNSYLKALATVNPYDLSPTTMQNHIVH